MSRQEILESLIPLEFVMLSGGSLKGRTRIQKLVFLLERESKLPVDYNFEKGNYGPFSFKLFKVLTNLSGLGLLSEKSRTTPSGRLVVHYELTKAGRSFLKMACKQKMLSKKVRGDVEQIYQEYGGLPIVQLLEKVYNEYPSWAENSIFKFRK